MDCRSFWDAQQDILLQEFFTNVMLILTAGIYCVLGSCILCVDGIIPNKLKAAGAPPFPLGRSVAVGCVAVTGAKPAVAVLAVINNS